MLSQGLPVQNVKFIVFDMYVYRERTGKVNSSFQAGVSALFRFQGSISLRRRVVDVAEGGRCSHDSLLAISWPKYKYRKGGFQSQPS